MRDSGCFGAMDAMDNDVAEVQDEEPLLRSTCTRGWQEGGVKTTRFDVSVVEELSCEVATLCFEPC